MINQFRLIPFFLIGTIIPFVSMTAAEVFEDISVYDLEMGRKCKRPKQGPPGPQGVTGVTGVTGSTGTTGPTGVASLGSFASFFTKFNNLNGDPEATILPSNPILFDQQSIAPLGITNNSLTGDITVISSGVYHVVMGAALAAADGQLALTADGIIVPGSQLMTGVAGQLEDTSFIFSVASGQVLRFANVGVASVILQSGTVIASGATGATGPTPITAFITIEKIHD